MKLLHCIFSTKKFLTILIIMSCILFSSCHDEYRKTLHSIDADNIKTYAAASEISSDKGFNNDGTVIYIFTDLKKSEISKVIDESQKWNIYTPDTPVNLLLYGGQYDSTYYSPLTDFNQTISDGYYYFVDRQNSKSNYDITDILEIYDRNSINCILAIIDTNTDTLYYFQYNS